MGGEDVLLLQGPMGDFFKQLELVLRKNGAITHRIGFNAGDWFFSFKDNYTPYKGKKEFWSDFIAVYLKEHQIKKIFLFGDCRYYQSIAIKEAQKLGIETYVFEEGYVRPDYVTMEKWGVNNFSKIPRNSNFYNNLDISFLDTPKVSPTHPNHLKMILSSTFYYIITHLGTPFYRHYEHHRELNPYREALFGIRNFLRKYKYKILEKGKLEEILQQQYFFVPLQTYNDFQLRTHSNFDSIENFLEIVLESFSLNAQKDKKLVIKHHPVDRGRKDYKSYIYKLAKRFNISLERLYVVYDLHLPTLLDHTLGTITINSTVGLQALGHDSAVKVLGNAIYDIDNICDAKPLEDFWIKPAKPNKTLFKKFRTYLIRKTQINGHFYGYFDFETLLRRISEK